MQLVLTLLWTAAVSSAAKVSVPLLVWTNTEAALPSSVFAADAKMLETAPMLDCMITKSVIVHWPNLKASDMSRYADVLVNLRSAFGSAKTSSNIAHFVANHATTPVKALQSVISHRCNQHMDVLPWTKATDQKDGELHVPGILLVELENLQESTPMDKLDALQRDDTNLGTALATIARVFPDHIVYLTSSLTSTSSNTGAVFKRQATATASPSLLPYSKRPIILKYVFFTDALFMGLLSTVILLGIMFAGVRILMGLQTPTRFDTLKREK